MANSSRFDFCEKCGALSRDGECQSCGHKDPKYVTPIQPTVQYNNPALAQPKSNDGGIIALIVVSIVILFLFLTCGVGFITLALTTDITDKFVTTGGYYEDNYRDEDFESWEDSGEDSYGSSYGGSTYPSQDVEGLESGKYYLDLYSDIRYDLDYQVEMTSGYYAPEEYENVMVDIEYPVISGNVDNLDTINGLLEYEYTYYLDYFEDNYKSTMLPTGYYMVYATCYVTYMDENVMSVVFQEEVLLDDLRAINFYCLNFDMKNGMVLNNTEILNMDEEFAADFRVREILENGEEALPDYTDQQIMELLNDEDYLVIFYTPMGMEVGLNLGSSVIFMTYSDYERFLNTY